jgi:CubicO group peptidase (beta-lactamase class C family)
LRRSIGGGRFRNFHRFVTGGISAYVTSVFYVASLVAQCQLPVAKPEQVGLSPAGVEQFVAAARQAKSDGLAIFKNGRYVAGFGENKRRELRSVTKAVVGMAAGRLFTEGKFASLDDPLRKYVPALADDPKGAVTLRQLMSHTSGIRDARDASGRVLKSWNDSRDFVAAARALPMENTPGAEYKYNNQGPVWIAEAIERATGERLDKFIARTIFAPLCIKEYDWWRDKTGRPAGYTGLSLSAYDLAKLGQLLLNRGDWNGQRILSEDWVRQSAHVPSQSLNPRIGLFWFLTMQQQFPISTLTHHNGDGYQYLFFFPNHGVVVARVASREDEPEYPILRLAVEQLIEKR